MQGSVKHQSSRWFESSLNHALLMCYSVSTAGGSQSKATGSPGARMKCGQLKFLETTGMFGLCHWLCVSYQVMFTLHVNDFEFHSGAGGGRWWNYRWEGCQASLCSLTLWVRHHWRFLSAISSRVCGNIKTDIFDVTSGLLQQYLWWPKQGY